MIHSTASVQVNINLPQSDGGKRALSQRMAEILAEAVIDTIKNMPCSVNDQQELLDAVIRSVQKKTG